VKEEEAVSEAVSEAASEAVKAGGVGGNRRPLDPRGLTPSRAAVLDLVLAGVTDAPVIAQKRGASRQSIYEHLEHLIRDGWVVKAYPAGNRTVAFQPTVQARTWPAQIPEGGS
jgi:DNA invertase Pin-like site-specific DNA recombinase